MIFYSLYRWSQKYLGISETEKKNVYLTISVKKQGQIYLWVYTRSMEAVLKPAICIKVNIF